MAALLACLPFISASHDDIVSQAGLISSIGRYNPAVKSKRSNVEQGSLFEMDRPDGAVSAPSRPNIGRPFDHPHLLLGTSAFTAAGWAGSFYPIEMKSDDYLAFYASKFKTVEIDSTY
jgi:hypothetical protein